jgi:hypothetical protein
VAIPSGQHVFGDVRAAIGEQLRKQLEARYAASKTQGAVAAMNPTAFRETRDIAWQLGRKHNLLPSMHLALVAQNMSTHHTFIGAEIGPCTWCNAEQGASAAHLLQCPALAEERAPFEEQIYQTFVSGAAVELGKLESQPTRQQVLQNILHVQAVDDQAEDENHVPAPAQGPAAQKKADPSAPDARATTPSPRVASRPLTRRNAMSAWPQPRQPPTPQPPLLRKQ